MGGLLHICSWDGWSTPGSDPLTRNAPACVGKAPVKSSSGTRTPPPPSAVVLLPGSQSHSSSLLSPRLESLIADPPQVLSDGLAACPETASEILLDGSNSGPAGGREESQGREGREEYPRQPQLPCFPLPRRSGRHQEEVPFPLTCPCPGGLHTKSDGFDPHRSSSKRGQGCQLQEHCHILPTKETSHGVV